MLSANDQVMLRLENRPQIVEKQLNVTKSVTKEGSLFGYISKKTKKKFIV